MIDKAAVNLLDSVTVRITGHGERNGRGPFQALSLANDRFQLAEEERETRRSEIKSKPMNVG